MRLTSKNSLMGRRLAKREETEVERRLSKRPPMFMREVSASMGMLKRDIVEYVKFEADGRVRRWASRSLRRGQSQLLTVVREGKRAGDVSSGQGEEGH